MAQKNEGEGNYTAARIYDQQVARFAKSGKVEQKAKEARRAIDGPEGKDLSRAEEIGKRRSKGEDRG